MPRSSPPSARDLRRRLAAFVGDRYPFALKRVLDALERALARTGEAPDGARALDRLREPLAEALARQRVSGLPRATVQASPGVELRDRLAAADAELGEACDGFLRRESIVASLARDEKLEILRGMVLTRAVDNQLKAFFMGGDVRYGTSSFQGKGFRSLGQEAIYAAPLRLKRGDAHRTPDGWQGDVVAPLIRDLGAALAMSPTPESVFMALNAQMGKTGPPMDGRDFHIGDLERGILPSAAPLTISTMSAVGMAMAFGMEGNRRVTVSFIGEGGCSLGEWHEAINLAAARRLPAIFCVQNNQTALSTPVREQSAVRAFADKAAGYGVPGVTADGTDPEAIAAAFAWAAERARAGAGPTLIELVAMRMCGHAHHDDMLYLGHETPPSWEYPAPRPRGYADADAWAYWAAKDPITNYAARLQEQGVIGDGDLESIKKEVAGIVSAARKRVIETPWPEAARVGERVWAEGPPAIRVEPLAGDGAAPTTALPEIEDAPSFDRNGRTFLEAVMLGVRDALRNDRRTFVYGQDVGGAYGNAFLLLRPLLDEFGDRILNSTLSEGGVLGVCVGAALAGRRPIGEIQFNDFVATGFNQLVNNAAKIRYRWGGSVPMVVRMPWGGLRRAGPYHSQNTEPWFYRTPGLKIVAPSTPLDARALMATAVADPDPVLYYEHIALYRDSRIKQPLPEEPPAPLPLGRAALRRAGSDLAIVSYGAYAHAAMRVAERLAADGIETAVLDLRCLVPLDRDALLRVTRHCGKVLIAHEDSRTGGIGESLAAVIQEAAFEHLDAPVCVVGALDCPVPYSPPLEDAFLADDETIERTARRLAAY